MSRKLKLSQIPSALLGITYFKKKEYQKAKDIFSKLLGKDPDNAYLNFRYGMCFYKEKEWVDARRFISKAVRLNPMIDSWKKQLATTNKNITNASKARVNDAKSKLAEVNSKGSSKKDILALQWDYAISLYNDKQYWMSIIQLNKYLEMNPKSAKAHYQLGIIYESLNDFDNAVKSLETAVTLDNRNKNYHYRLGYCYENNHQFDKSQKEYDIVINKLSNQNDEIREFGIGLFHSKRGLWIDAISAYEDFIQKNNTMKATNFYKLAFAYERAYFWDKAAETYKKAIQQSPINHADWYFRCGQAYEKIDNFDMASYFYNEAVLRSNNYNDYWYFRYAYVLGKLGNFEESNFIYEHSRRRKLLHGVSPSGVIKDKEEEFLTYYTEYYETLPIKENFVLFESFFGNNISCNPYAILKHMVEIGYNYRFVLVIQKDTEIPGWIKKDKNIILVQRNSDLYLRYLASAKYLINNVSFPYYFIRREEQKYLNTWHGTPMKTLGKDIKNPFQDHSNVMRNFLHTTHMISQNEYTTNIMLDKYDIRHMYSGRIANTGYPRVDLTLNLSNARKEEIYKKLSIDPTKPVVLYAPTWRGTSDSKQFDTKKLQYDLEYLSSEDYQLLFRGHHLAEKIISDVTLNVRIVPRDIDTNELLGVTNVLISDYSSIVYDFLPLNRPIISYIYDFDEYVRERGMYMTRDELVGDLAMDIKQLKSLTLALSKSGLSNIKQEDIDKFSYLDDGKVTERVIDFFFNDNNEYCYIYKKKPVDLFFVGPLLSNGIVRSFNNLVSCLDEKHERVLLISPNDIVADVNRMEEFNRLPTNLSVFGRTGRMLMTLEEIWIRKKFAESFEFSSPMFKEKLVRMYQRECRRMFGDTYFNSSINFEGYALFWVMLTSQINAKHHIIFQHNDKYSEWKSKFPYLKGVFNAYNFFDKIVSVSEKTRDNNRKNLASIFNLPEEKFVFCNNTIDYQKILESADQKVDLDDSFKNFNGRKVLNMGRMSHEKDQKKLIIAFSRIALKENIRLYILGTGPLKSELEALIKELNMEEYIFLLGQKKNPFPYLKQSDVFVLSSNHEGQPMVLLESLVLGIPVIATDIVGNRSVLGNKYGLLVENNIDGLVYGFEEYLSGHIDSNGFNYEEYQIDALNTFNNLIKP